MGSSTLLYIPLGAALFLATFGLYGIIVAAASTACFIFGFFFVIYTHGRVKMSKLESKMKSVLQDPTFETGHKEFLDNIKRFRESTMYDHKTPMTTSPQMDRILEQILEYVMRDFVDGWYKQLCDDQLFRESLMRTMRRTIFALSQCMREVDWVPFVTRHMADDFASHLRLYRMASERAAAQRAKDPSAATDDLESHFFDLELEMENNLCRDLLSTTPHYENAYLHDLVDILLYLLMPLEDFRCRPLRFLVREVLVKRIITPTLDHLSDPENVNQLLVWLLSEIAPRTEDIVSAVDLSDSHDELEALLLSLREQLIILRGKDGDGEHEVVKAQMASLEYLEGVIRRRQETIEAAGIERGCDAGLTSLSPSPMEELVQLPLHVVLNNSVAVSHLMDYLVRVGGQNYMDCYLAIDGFKVSVEHQLRSLVQHETTESEVRETVREAALFMHQQYLSEEAITRVPLDESLVKQLMNRIRKEGPSDDWFEDIQNKIAEILRKEERFYPSFKRDALYLRMLHELGIVGPEAPAAESDNGSQWISDGGAASEGVSPSPSTNAIGETRMEGGAAADSEPLVSCTVETLGIGQQGKQSFALYNLRVTRTLGGRRVSGWNVLRRYSDFHLLHTVLIQKYPDLGSVSFPGKKTFNNLSAHFLEKRTKALNQYMECVLQPSLLRSHSGMDKLLMDFLSQKEYTGKVDPLSKKVISAMFDPIRSSVRAVTSAVTAMPDQVYDGVSRMGDGLNKAAMTIIKPVSSMGASRNLNDTGRVAASLSSRTDSIPLRVLILLVDEVFGMRTSQAWIRRQLLTILRQVVTPLGTSINKRIISVVHWLASETQVTSYLAALRDTVWPNGRLGPPTPPRPASFHHKSRILVRVLLLSALPEQLRMILSTDTTNQGIGRVTSALQRRHLNRRLLYVVIERLLITIFPHNRFERIFAQLHSKSPRSKRA